MIPDRDGANQRMAQVQANCDQLEWRTPAYIMDAVRYSFLSPIDLDPATTALANATIRAERIFTKEDNGLVQSWAGRNVWLNPPSSRRLIPLFVDKFLVEYEACAFEEAAIITNNATETQWAQRLAAKASAVCMLDGSVPFEHLNERGKYYTPRGGSVQGQLVWFFEKDGDPDRFGRAFEQLGISWWH